MMLVNLKNLLLELSASFLVASLRRKPFSRSPLTKPVSGRRGLIGLQQDGKAPPSEGL